MKIPYFFKAKSRIGLKNNPNSQAEPNIGVEEGPEAILTPEFLKKFPRSRVAEFEFPRPEDIPEAKFNQVLVESIKNFKNVILSATEGSYMVGVDSLAGKIPHSVRNDNINILIGGDHSVVLPSILADLERYIDPNKIGVLHIDSHGDINLYHQSPSKNFHGMYLRPLFDNFDIPEIEKLVPEKIPTSNLMMIGNLDLDPGEVNFIRNKGIKTWNITKHTTVVERFVTEVLEFIMSLQHLHVSFDIDVFDKSIAPATGIPAKEGFLWEDIKPILEIIANHPSFSFDLCEVNPAKAGAGKTIKLAQEIIRTILKK
jgi:arginase